MFDQAESLFRIGKYLTSLVIVSLWQGPEVNATYADIANKMLELEEDDERKVIIREEFKKREILDAPLSLAGIQPGSLSWDGCCGTLRGQEYQAIFENSVSLALKNRK